MKQSILMGKYPTFDLEIPKSETSHTCADDILTALKVNIDAHPKVAFIGIFDHLSHTKSIDGDIADAIIDAKNIIFCFGMKLPNPRVMAVRPRSIGVTDMGSHFHIAFMEPPMSLATSAMENWCKALADTPA